MSIASRHLSNDHAARNSTQRFVHVSWSLPLITKNPRRMTECAVYDNPSLPKFNGQRLPQRRDLSFDAEN